MTSFLPFCFARGVLLACLFLGLELAHAERPGNRLPASADLALKVTSTATLYSMEPMAAPAPGDKMLYRYKVLGSVELSPQATITAVAAFRKSVQDFNGSQAGCFLPRHALRVKAPDATYDFLLCYECGYMDVYQKARRIARLGASGSPAALNKFMVEHGLPLAKPIK